MSTPILFFHGTPGNDYQANAFRAFAFNEVITWDRKSMNPYTGRAHLLAFSGGGPFALEYAKMYPERVRSLTMWSALTGPPPSSRFPFRPFGRLLINLMGRRLIKRKPSWAWKGWLRQNAVDARVYDQAVNDHRSQGVFWQLVKSQVPLRLDEQLRQEISFLRNYKYQGPKLSCPIFVMHDVNDKNVPASHVFRLVEFCTNIQEMKMVRSTGHLCFFGYQAQDAIKDWADWLVRHSD